MKSRMGKLLTDLYKGIIHTFEFLLFREINGQSVASGRIGDPTDADGAPAKGTQILKDAADYAQRKLTDLDYKKAAGSNDTVYDIAVADYLNPPIVLGIDADNYEGLPGSVILIEAVDDFLVASVKVRIMDGNGALVEEGDARRKKGFDWRYTTTAVNNSFPGSIIGVMAYDKPGNFGIAAVRDDGTVVTADIHKLAVS